MQIHHILKTCASCCLAVFLPMLVIAGLANPVQADNMESASYFLQFGNFNMGSGAFDPGSAVNLTYTMGGTAIGPYGEYGTSSYFVGSGFQYIYQIDQFTFKLSKLSIDLGELTAGSFATDSHQLTINTGSAGGYQVYVFENHPLRHLTQPSATVQDTNCNAGCSESIAGIWDNPDYPGFGYRVFGDDVATDFINDTYYRRFADNSMGEDMQAIMASDNIAIDATATVTYQAAPAGNQIAGDYQTSIIFVAVPGY